jgi:hypothetical protein
MKIYLTLTRPVITYAPETGTLSEHDKPRLRLFERQTLRKLFGPPQTGENTWRIRSNAELDCLINGADIVKLIKAQRISWFGHMQRLYSSVMVK